MKKPSQQKVVFFYFKQSKSGMSPPKVIMIAFTFTMSILCVTLEPTTFYMSFPEVMMIANVFTSLKHQISIKPSKKSVALKAKMKNDVTRQAKSVGDSCIAASARSPRYMNY